MSEPWTPDPLTAWCSRCGATVGPAGSDAQGCARCRSERFPWHRLTRLSAYTPPMADWLRAMKFARQWRWAEDLGRHLADRLDAPPPGLQPIVVPVPMPRLRRVRRGFNQAELIAQSISKHKGWPPLPALRRIRHTTPQSLLPASKRPENVRGSIACDPVDLTGHAAFLIDDIKTTGSTLRLCARLLADAGCPLIHVGVLAVADPKGQDFKTLDHFPSRLA